MASALNSTKAIKMTLEDIIHDDCDSALLKLWIAKVPYATFLGIQADVCQNDILFTLPADKNLIGNPSIEALHGGVVGAFMEQSAAFHVIAKMERPVLPKIINFSLDYLRPAHLRDTYAECLLTRQGRFITNVTIIAWQEHKNKPNAIARAHFLTPETERKESTNATMGPK